MLEFVGWTALVLGALASAIALIASRRPAAFTAARTLRINATPERLFPLINDLKSMNSWNPFVLRDPAIKGHYSGPISGPGARYSFESKKSGTGSCEITEAAAPSKVVMQLKMVRPVQASNRVTMSIVPAGDATDLTWSMSGERPLTGKIMSLFLDWDKMMGGEFETGLANLKSIAERR